MGWNHRVIKKVEKDDTQVWYGIHEVYYDKDGNVDGYTMEPRRLLGENIDELRWTLEKMIEALEKPVLIEIETNDKNSLLINEPSIKDINLLINVIKENASKGDELSKKTLEQLNIK